MKPKIIFNDSARDFVLGALGHSVNDDGFIVDSEGLIVLSTSNETIKADELGGMYKGENGTEFVKDDLGSIMDLVDKNNKNGKDE